MLMRSLKGEYVVVVESIRELRVVKWRNQILVSFFSTHSFSISLTIHTSVSDQPQLP